MAYLHELAEIVLLFFKYLLLNVVCGVKLYCQDYTDTSLSLWHTDVSLTGTYLQRQVLGQFLFNT